MDEMREIVTREQVEHWFLLLALVAPVVGAALGALGGGLKGRVGAGAAKGFLIGLVGPVNLLLWKIYNGITDRLGLDSVKNLVVNLALFIGLGIGAGLIAGFLYRRGMPHGPDEGLAPVGATPAPTAGGAGAGRRSEESDTSVRDA